MSKTEQLILDKMKNNDYVCGTGIRYKNAAKTLLKKGLVSEIVITHNTGQSPYSSCFSKTTCVISTTIYNIKNKV